VKWVWVGAGVIVGLVLIVVAIGAVLPREHVATMSARIAAQPAAVWDAITKPEAFANWRTDVTRVDVLAPAPTGPSWREHTRNGALTMVVDRADPPRHLTTRIADVNLPYGGLWEYDIAPDGSDGSVVTITERGWVSNPIFRFVSRFIMGHTATIDAYLRALGRHFGSEPTPQRISSSESPDGR
jgi:uncharacterized protein YndB with AHSA1/START domain